MMVLGLIPARGGSKRVPGKNLRMLAGKPLIAHTIEAALKADCIGRLIVSTDDEAIAAVAREYGAEVPFMRPSNLGEDTTPDQPVFRHAVQWLADNGGYEPDIILNLRPTTPLKTPEIICHVVERLGRGDVEIVRTMTKVEGVHHPYWMYKIDENGATSSFVGGLKVSDYYQSQLLPPTYRINGMVDGYKRAVVTGGDILASDNMAAVITQDDISIDIDTELDLRRCELLMEGR